MKKVVLLLFVVLSSFNSIKNVVPVEDKRDKEINQLLDAWHKAAGQAQYDVYFAMMTPDAIFIGTDATENWNKTDFKIWAKPFFDRGKAWNFAALERHIYYDASGKTAWFDELLDTQMKICRGSGVVVKVGNQWKIKHYVLSMTIPNDNVDAVVKIKAPIEEALMQKMKQK